jgi:hypothetical protein
LRLPSDSILTYSVKMIVTQIFQRRKRTPERNLAVARGANQCLHMIEIFFQRAAAVRSDAVLRFRQPVRERLGARDVAGVFEFASVNAEIAVRYDEELLEFVECERFVDCKGADDRQTSALVNQAIQIRRGFRRTRRRNGPVCLFVPLEAGCVRFSHHISSQ